MVYLARGNLEKASIHAQEALTFSLKNHELENEGLSRILLGQVIAKTEQSKFDDARQSMVEGIKILENLKLRSQYAVGYFELGELHADNGHTEKALENLKKAEAMFQEMGMDYWLGKTQEVLGAV